MEKRKKAMVALLVFIIATLKSLVDVNMCICECMHVRMYKETDGTGLTLEHMYVCQQGPQS